MSIENVIAYNQMANVISIGINMACKKVLIKCVLYSENGNYYLIHNNLHIKCDSLDGVLLDTKENRKVLKSQML